MTGVYLDSMRFGYGGPSDVMATASSLDHDWQCRSEWAQWLLPHARVADRDRPEASMVYLSDGSRAAVLCRRRGPQQAGRKDNTNALLGAAADLTVDLALDLHRWPGWDDPCWDRRNLPTWLLSAITNDTVSRHAAIPSRSRQWDDAEVVVAALLRSPSRAVSIVSDPSPLPGRMALISALVCAVGWLFENADGPPFGFSTFEIQHDDSKPDQPTVVFVPRDLPSKSGFSVSRATVELPPRHPADDYATAAAELVDLCRRPGSQQVRQWAGEHGLLEPHAVSERVSRLMDLLALPEDPPPTSPSPESAVRPARAEVSSLPGDELTLLDRIRAADPDDVHAALLELDRRGPAAPGVRPELQRRLLDPREEWERHLRSSMSSAELPGAADKLVRFAFDSRDFSDPVVVAQTRLRLAAFDAPVEITAGLHRRAHAELGPIVFPRPDGVRARLGAWLAAATLRSALKRAERARRRADPQHVRRRRLRLAVAGLVLLTGIAAVVFVRSGDDAPAVIPTPDLGQSLRQLGSYQAVHGSYEFVLDRAGPASGPVGAAAPDVAGWTVSGTAVAVVDLGALGVEAIVVDAESRTVTVTRPVVRVDAAVVSLQPAPAGAQLLQQATARAAQETHRRAESGLTPIAVQHYEALIASMVGAYGYRVVFL